MSTQRRIQLPGGTPPIPCEAWAISDPEFTRDILVHGFSEAGKRRREAGRVPKSDPGISEGPRFPRSDEVALRKAKLFRIASLLEDRKLFVPDEQAPQDLPVADFTGLDPDPEVEPVEPPDLGPEALTTKTDRALPAN